MCKYNARWCARSAGSLPTFLHLDALGLEEVPQSADLLLELPDQLGVAVLVDHGLADDRLGPGHGCHADYC